MKQVCFLSILITILFSYQAKAQKKVGDLRLGFGFNGGISLSDLFDFSLGLDARLQYDISLKTSLAATTGYTNLLDSEIKGLGFVPPKIGFKSFFGDQFDVLGEFGTAIGTKSGMGTSFLWAPRIGVATNILM